MTSSSATSRKALSKIACGRLQKELVEWQRNLTANLQRELYKPMKPVSFRWISLNITLWKPPQVIFLHPAPLHPHIYSNGHICFDILYDSWSLAMTVSSICISILSMLSSSTVKQYPEDNDRYVKNCRNGQSSKQTRCWFHDNKI